jgi:hypothetical protein
MHGNGSKELVPTCSMVEELRRSQSQSMMEVECGERTCCSAMLYDRPPVGYDLMIGFSKVCCNVTLNYFGPWGWLGASSGTFSSQIARHVLEELEHTSTFFIIKKNKSNLLSFGVVDPMSDIALYAGGLTPDIYRM